MNMNSLLTKLPETIKFIYEQITFFKSTSLNHGLPTYIVSAS